MPGKFKQIDHTADIAFEVIGESIEELFSASASAWRKTVSDEKDLKQKEIKEIKLNSSSLEILLVDFLSELNYKLFTKNWLFNSIKKIDITYLRDSYMLISEIEGSPLTQGIKIKQEIKAITFHQMNIRYEKGLYFTLIVFDI